MYKKTAEDNQEYVAKVTDNLSAHLQNPVFGDKQKKANIAVNTRRLITIFHLSLTAANPFPGRD
jgi:hypothetical protein